MSLNLGLESINNNMIEDKINDIDTLMNLCDTSNALIEESQGIEELLVVYTNLRVITSNITRHGVTESLYDLIGDSFTNKVNVALEAEEAKRNVFGRILDAIRKFFSTLWIWFKSLITSVNGAKKILYDLMSKAETFTYPIMFNPTGELRILSYFYDAIEKYTDTMKNEKERDHESILKKDYNHGEMQILSLITKKTIKYYSSRETVYNSRDLKELCTLYINTFNLLTASQKDWEATEKRLMNFTNLPNTISEEDRNKDIERVTKYVQALNNIRTKLVHSSTRCIKGVYRLKSKCVVSKKPKTESK